MIAIPYSLSVNKVFASPSNLVVYAEHKAETSGKLNCESDAFTLMVRIEPHRRGYKLVSLFYLDNGLVEQQKWQDDTLYTFPEIEYYEFASLG